MVDERDMSSVVMDASPLIYLAKLDALEVFAATRRRAIAPPAVHREVANPTLTYIHPDAVLLDDAFAHGLISIARLSASEAALADSFAAQVPGMHEGEREVLAIARQRELPAVLFERRGQRVAHALGVQLIDVLEVLFDGTPQLELLSDRIKRLAEMVDMRLADYEVLQVRLQRRRSR